MCYTVGDDGQHIEIVTCQPAIILPFFINVINAGNSMCVCNTYIISLERTYLVQLYG